MTTETVRQLTVNITATNTWTQLKAAGTVYVIPSGGQGISKSLSAANLGANSATVEFAISTDSTIDDVEKVWPPITVAAGGLLPDEHNFTHVLQSLEGLWARAVGTSPNVTFRADVLELVA